MSRPMTPNVSTFIGCASAYEDAQIVLFGAPFDSTTSYRPGTRFGSAAIRNESFGLETYSPYQEKDLSDYAIIDIGDLELFYGNARTSLDAIRECSEQIIKDNKLPFMVGGEHLVTLGNFEAIHAAYPDVYMLHFDAHADLREEFFGEQLSHATVIRRCWDLVGDGRIFQFGIRSMSREEDAWAKEHVSMNKFCFDQLKEVVASLHGKPIYLTIDLDVLDPSFFPGTGTPEAGGVSFIELLDAITLVSQLSIVGCDVNELAPMLDASGASSILACKVVRELLLSLSK